MQKPRMFKKGLKASLPVVLGYVPVGTAFGVLAAQAGLNIWEVFFMSLMVYAGSAQFIGTGMIAAGASPVAIIITTFLVNSRHILMSASLSPYLKKHSSGILSVIGFGITDETFAVAMTDVLKEEKGPEYFLALNFTSQFFWIISTVAGAAVGNIIPDPGAFGLQFALPAMFIGLLIIQIRSGPGVLLALFAAMFSVLLKLLLPGNWNVIIASILTATIGVIVETWKSKSSPSSSV